MNLFDYIDSYGIYSFSEKPFNEVDSVLFSFLPYVKLTNIVSQNKVRLSDVGRIHLGLHDKKEKNITAVRDATKLLNYMKDTKRYGDCLFSHYVYETTNDYQFGVISIEYQKGHVYIAFEGTDEMISGWIDDFMLSYNFPTVCHKKAVAYLNKLYTYSFKKLIIGGHSRGGNLALAAAMGSNFLVRSKIIGIYNADGPGVLDYVYRSNAYKRILPKYHHIIPNDSIVGVMLHQSNEEVVSSSVTGALAHDILYWEVDHDHFKKGKLSSFSKTLHKELLSFIDSYSTDELKKIIDNLNKVCERSGVKSLLEFRESPKNIIRFISSCSMLDMESRNMLYDLLNVFIRSIGNSKYRDFMEFVKRFELDI